MAWLYFWDETPEGPSRQGVTELKEVIDRHTSSSPTQSSRGGLHVDSALPSLGLESASTPANLVQFTQPVDSSAGQLYRFIECMKIQQKFPDSFALEIDGDSMSPRINDRDIVIISPSVCAVDGSAAVVQLKDQIGVTCKVLRTANHQIHLIPINEKYEIKTVPRDSLLWSLAVLCHVKLPK